MKKDKKQADKKLDVWGWVTPLRSKNGASEGQAKQSEESECCCGGGHCCEDHKCGCC